MGSSSSRLDIHAADVMVCHDIWLAPSEIKLSHKQEQEKKTHGAMNSKGSVKVTVVIYYIQPAREQPSRNRTCGSKRADRPGHCAEPLGITTEREEWTPLLADRCCVHIMRWGGECV